MAGRALVDDLFHERLPDALRHAALHLPFDNHGVHDDANVVMLVGHAPGIPALASILAEGDGSERAHDLMSQGYPTAGVAVLRFSGRWGDLAAGVARLDRFHVARSEREPADS